jgi:hypothetical protein
MRILLVEPDYRRPAAQRLLGREKRPDDETLWYPPLGLMKLARYHKNLGHHVEFVVGRDPKVLKDALKHGPLFAKLWDRVYITTLFTFHFDDVVKTINYYKEAVGGTNSKIFVGGIMATLMQSEIYEETGIVPITGIIDSARQLGISDETSIDGLPPDYSFFEKYPYGIWNTFYAYTTRGCKHKCAYCGVHKLEPKFVPYINIKNTIQTLRDERGDLPILKLMDNNILGSSELERIVDDLIELGYGRNEYTKNHPRRQRVIDFNQGLDASHLTEKKMAILAKLNIEPMRIAFDQVREQKDYARAVRLAHKYGVTKFSNYMLYNFRDTPKDLYQRLKVNIELNEEMAEEGPPKRSGKIYSYPMRFAPIADPERKGINKTRDIIAGNTETPRDWLREPIWTKRFIRNIEIMKGAANGAISPTPSLAWRTIGRTFEEFLSNLYMPEELIRNRNRHERKVHKEEPKRKPGSGQVERFRTFIRKLLKENGNQFMIFHRAVSSNSTEDVRSALQSIQNGEMKKWMEMYLSRPKSTTNTDLSLEAK